jgi:hypothetical protein
VQAQARGRTHGRTRRHKKSLLRNRTVYEPGLYACVRKPIKQLSHLASLATAGLYAACEPACGHPQTIRAPRVPACANLARSEPNVHDPTAGKDLGVDGISTTVHAWSWPRCRFRCMPWLAGAPPRRPASLGRLPMSCRALLRLQVTRAYGVAGGVVTTSFLLSGRELS